MRTTSQMTRRSLVSWGLAASAAIGSSLLLAACGAPPAPTAAPAAVPPKTAPAPAVKPAEPAKPVEAAKPAEVAKPAEAKPAAGAPAAKSGVTLRFHMRAGGEKSEPAIYVDRPTEWEAETGNKIKLEPIPGGKDYNPKILALAVSNTLGDVLFTGDTMSEHTHLVRNNVIEPVDTYVDKSGVKKTDWLKPIVDQLTHNGKMYGLPKTGHPGEPFIWVNLAMFDKAGIKRPSITGTTFDDLKTWANAFSKGPKDKRDVYGFYTSVKGAQGVTTGVRMRGSDVVEADGKTSFADNDAWYQWMEWNYKLIVEDVVHPLTIQNAGTELPSMFESGKLAMFHGARYLHFPTRAQVKDKFDWMVIQYPKPANNAGYLTAVDTHSGTQVSKLKDESFSLIAAMSDKRFAYLVGKTQGYLTGRVDALESLKEVAEDPFMKLQYDCGKDQRPMWRCNNLRAYEIETEINSRIDELMLGKRKLDKPAMQEMKKALDAILAKPVL